MSSEQATDSLQRLSESRVTSLQDALERLVATKQFPAAALGLVTEHGILHLAAAGVVGDSIASPCTSVFPVASISKTVVAALCLQSCARGELDLDKNVNEYLLQECHVQNPHFPEAPITPRHLLMHRSGLQDDEEALYSGSIWRVDGCDCSIPLSEYVFKRFNPKSDLFEKRLWSKKHPPGEARYSYSNAGFAILGLVLETVCVTGAGGLDDLAATRLFSPLGMTHSSFKLSKVQEMSDVQIAIPHGEGIQHYGVCEYPAASLRSTAEDLSQYLVALISGLSHKGPCVDGSLGLDDGLLKQLLPLGEYCEGGLAWWGVDSCYGNQNGTTWEHGGCMDGVRSHIYIWPQWRVGAVLMGNGESNYTSLTAEIKAAFAEHLGMNMSSF